ncbi:hypothetical protein WOLCODRAFT_21329 [Wolfiporia cocos MD-104 SS10]|uniref:Uncharacterized protein n=1 Tax=Wolfiporia cocos (strain MD-104) TaxID=742152 RepID=A0A2H3JA26_WOLCO|nr:hypothetical protein WOLCODRAFT_21329 [Wolfiporia cocos MD-104 SS10]
MKHELQMLNLRTGIECAIIGTRGDLDTYNSPYYYATSKRVADFFEATFKTNLADIGLRMEAYLISGIQGIVSNHVQELLDLKEQMAALILHKLNEAAKTKVPRMYYNNFKTSITAKYGVVCEGWLLSKFCCPSDVGSCTELMVLNHAFKSGSARFHAMGTEEFKKWQDKQFQAAIGGVENREDSGSDMSNLSNTILTPPSTLAPATLAPSTLAPQSSAPTMPLPTFVPPPTFVSPASALETPLYTLAPLPLTSNTLHLQQTGTLITITMDHNSEQQCSTPLTTNFINAVTAADGSGVLSNAKQ